MNASIRVGTSGWSYDHWCDRFYPAVRLMAMLNEEELRQVRDDVIRILPELWREEPETVTIIVGILAWHFPRRYESTHLLDELKQGRTLEDMFAVMLRYGLKNQDIRPENIRLRQRLVDTEGHVFKAGFETEVDLIAEDGRLTVFEVKATAKPGDVDFLALKAELVAAQNPDKSVDGVFISLAAPPEVRQRCADYGLELLD